MQGFSKICLELATEQVRTSKKLSCTIWVSASKKTVRLPSRPVRLSSFFRSSRHSLLP